MNELYKDFCSVQTSDPLVVLSEIFWKTLLPHQYNKMPKSGGNGFAMLYNWQMIPLLLFKTSLLLGWYAQSGWVGQIKRSSILITVSCWVLILNIFVNSELSHFWSLEIMLQTTNFSSMTSKKFWDTDSVFYIYSLVFCQGNLKIY